MKRAIKTRICQICGRPVQPGNNSARACLSAETYWLHWSCLVKRWRECTGLKLPEVVPETTEVNDEI